jgi:alpha-tubulin suppressor-like RCC1 family protein
MSTFLTIPLDEIHLFLLEHQLPYPEDEEEAYLEAWNYILDNPNLEISSPIILDFILAYNHQDKVTQSYSASSIMMSSDLELRRLAQSLGLTHVDRERIIRILRFLELLIDDVTSSSRLFQSPKKQVIQRPTVNIVKSKGQVSRKFIDLAAGFKHSLILNSQGRVFSFGDNSSGQLGLGDLVDRKVPTLIKKFEGIRGEVTIVALAAGMFHSLLLTEKGEVFSMGDNQGGQLGLGDEAGRLTPTLIETLDDIVAIAVGWNHSLFLDAQGRVFSCGDDTFGQLGSEFYGDLSAPTLMSLLEEIGISTVMAIAAGGYHSFILTTEGQVYSFGDNRYGMLGLGDTIERPIPTMIEIDDQIAAISAGESHSLMLDKQGLIFGFGRDKLGQLGLGDGEDRKVPTPLMIHNIAMISAGAHHSLVLNSQGQVFSFGKNRRGQLGLGHTGYVNLPTLIPGITDQEIYVIAISGGGNHSLLLTSTGQIYAFGRNKHGQLGLKDQKDRTVPTLIKDLVM